jgi:hypothetical protein
LNNVKGKVAQALPHFLSIFTIDKAGILCYNLAARGPSVGAEFYIIPPPGNFVNRQFAQKINLFPPEICA